MSATERLFADTFQPIDSYLLYFGVESDLSAYILLISANGEDICPDKTQYLAWVVNPAIFGNDFLHVYEIKKDGSLGNAAGVIEVNFDPTQRPWFSNAVIE